MPNSAQKKEKIRTEDPVGLKSKPRGAITNAGWNAFSTVCSIGISFVITPFLIFHLGAAQYGILLLIWSFTGILCLTNFGLGEATLRYVAFYYGDRDIAGINRVFNATLSFYIILCVIVSALVWPTAPIIVKFIKVSSNEHHLVEWLLRLSALVFSMTILTHAFGAIPMALHRYDITAKINIVQSLLRSLGYIFLIIRQYGLIYFVLWEMVTYFVTVVIQAAVVRKLLPTLKLFPEFSFRGLKEIFGYSLFSFLSHVFFILQREIGKLTLGTYLGPAPVAYLGTPTNIAGRAQMLIVSGTETLLPRFSASRNRITGQNLFQNSTWIGLVGSGVLLIPLIVLMFDFLTLWISPEFARESAAVGKLMAFSYIIQGAFMPASAFFRGAGKPWFVTGVIFSSSIGTLLFCIVLIPAYGLLGVGYAYVIGSTAHLVGALIGWFYLFGRSSLLTLMRYVGMPFVLAGVSFMVESAIRGCFINVNWFTLSALGILFAALTLVILVGGDRILGGESPSKELLERIGKIKRIDKFLRYVRAI